MYTTPFENISHIRISDLIPQSVSIVLLTFFYIVFWAFLMGLPKPFSFQKGEELFFTAAPEAEGLPVV